MADLPFDIIETILTRLPVKALLRFRSVSKLWQGTILNPRFAKLHMQVSRKNSQNLFFVWELILGDSGFGRFRLVKLENQQFRTEAVLTYPFGRAAAHCFCNGVVLLSKIDTRKMNFVLCNPFNRMYNMIQCPYKHDDYRTYYGLCYDAILDDYTIIIISRNNYIVYSLKNNTWTKKKNTLLGEIKFTKARGVFVDGAFYWIIRGSEAYKRVIICFDVRDDKVNKLQMPTDMKDNDRIFLKSLGGCLCLYSTSKSSDMKKVVQVWMMEEQSWKRLITIEDLHLQALHTRYARPVCFTNENDILIALSGSRFVTYSLRERSLEKFEDLVLDGCH